jgi:hypothetical protein
MHFAFSMVLFWVGWSHKREILCREFSRTDALPAKLAWLVVAERLKNSCEFAQFAAEVLVFPVKNGRAIFSKPYSNRATFSMRVALLGYIGIKGTVTFLNDFLRNHHLK